MQQHHHVTLTPKSDKIVETQNLLSQCAQQVADKKHENGPVSWCTSFDAGKQCFYVEALFSNQDAVVFHQNNIMPIVKEFSAFMAAPPVTVITEVFAVA